MSYEPTVWKTGDIVTSEKLNKLENGVKDAGGKTIIECHLSFDQETGMATATNLGAAFDALDAIAADMSLAANYALVITGLDDFIGGESSFPGGYCDALASFYDKTYKPAFATVNDGGVSNVIVRNYYADTGIIQYQCFGQLYIERNALDEAGNYVWQW